jgi:hypothetical protein
MNAHPGGNGTPPGTDAHNEAAPPAAQSPAAESSPGAEAPAAESPATEASSAESPAAEAPAERPAAKTTRQRAEQKRQEKLDFVREQVDNGSLVIRGMTEEERLRYPPLPTPPPRRGYR